MPLIKNILSVVAFSTQFSTSCATPRLDCKHLISKVDFGLHDATCLNSTYHQAGQFDLAGPVGPLTNDIAFHEIHASVAYAEGAELIFSIWLPDKDNYEGRFLGVGNGGYGGSIDRVSMLYHLNSGLGFAVAGGNAGHDSWVETNGTDGGTPGLYIPFLNYEERTKAWLHNAISLFTPLARAISEVAYGDQPKHAYFNGCSAGGGQAFALAEFHPDLYDGIVAGSPGNYQSHMWLSILWTFQAQQGEGALAVEVLQFIASAVLDICDDLDGVEDGVLENPLACPFEVESLACAKDEEPTGANGAPQCLTEGQVTAARRVYDGPSTSDTDGQLYPGFSLGAETNWIIPVLVGLANGFTAPILQNLIYKDLSWDHATFNYTAEEVAYIDKIGGPLVNSIGADLSDFRNHGGKILSTMGWADPAIAPLSAVEHRERLKAGLEDGVSIDEFYRLFMVPGGGHCSSVSLPQTPEEWHVMGPLIKWVEDDVAPESVLATTPQDGSGRTRKLCPWPETAVLVGDDEDDSESYECRLVVA